MWPAKSNDFDYEKFGSWTEEYTYVLKYSLNLLIKDCIESIIVESNPFVQLKTITDKSYWKLSK